MSTDRLALTLGTVAFAAVFYLLMLKGWRGRQQRQAELPAPPVALGRAPVLVGSVPGFFVGTVTDRSWLDRVAVHDLCVRAKADLWLATDGVHLERDGLDELFFPYAAVLSAQPGDRLAGKVMGRDGLLILTWRLGGQTLHSAFRATDHSAHARLALAITQQLPVEADR